MQYIQTNIIQTVEKTGNVNYLMRTLDVLRVSIIFLKKMQ